MFHSYADAIEAIRTRPAEQAAVVLRYLRTLLRQLPERAGAWHVDATLGPLTDAERLLLSALATRAHEGLLAAMDGEEMEAATGCRSSSDRAALVAALEHRGLVRVWRPGGSGRGPSVFMLAPITPMPAPDAPPSARRRPVREDVPKPHAEPATAAERAAAWRKREADRMEALRVRVGRLPGDLDSVVPELIRVHTEARKAAGHTSPAAHLARVIVAPIERALLEVCADGLPIDPSTVADACRLASERGVAEQPDARLGAYVAATARGLTHDGIEQALIEEACDAEDVELAIR